LAVVRDLGAQQLMGYAEEVATWAVQNRVPALAPCQDTSQDCAARFVAFFGERAHREPLSPTSLARYTALFTAEPDFQNAATAVLTALLQSPRLLYRREIGQPTTAPGEAALSPYELASQLSYLLTNRPPDAELRTAAAEGRLSSDADLQREFTRLLSLPAARENLDSFIEGWLDLEGVLSHVRSADGFEFTAELREHMLDESEDLFNTTLFSGGSVAALFNGTTTNLAPDLASLYGMPAGNVSLEQSNRAPGLLGQAAFLVAHALNDAPSPVQRGKVVRTRLLCQDVPAPPAGVDTNLMEIPPGSTNRERYNQHSADTACSGCHQSLDPIGFAFEHYDQLGRYRDTDAGQPIDASGAITGAPGGGDIPVNGLSELTGTLAQSEAVQTCLIRHWSYFAYGRDGWTNAGCNEGAIRLHANEGGNTLRSVLEGLVLAPHFARRVITP
jgi:hypothetical protein